MGNTTYFLRGLRKKHQLSRTNTAILFALYILSCLLMISCNTDAGRSSKAAGQKQKNSNGIGNRSKSQLPKVARNNLEHNKAVEVMNEKDIRFNGKLKRYFSLKEFQLLLGEPDSTKLLSEEEPCTNIFQEADGSVDPEAKYLYKNGSRFENAQDKVAIDEVMFINGDFIVFGKVTLNKHTTLAELKTQFPNAAKHIGLMNVAGEGKVQVIQLREDKDNISDGHINVFIKNGKLHSLHWWIPC